MGTIKLTKYLEKQTIRSFSHATSNEDGMEEFMIEFEQTWFQSLFGRAGTKLVFVRPKLRYDLGNLHGFEWVEKGSGRRPDTQWAINQYVDSVRGSTHRQWA